MKIALIKKKSEANNTTPRRIHLQKGPISSKPQNQFQFSPLDDAQYAIYQQLRGPTNPRKFYKKATATQGKYYPSILKKLKHPR